MAIRYINVGSSPNDNSGSTLREGGQLFNNNFSIMLNALSTDGSTLTINTAATPSNTYLSATYPSNTYLVATYPSNTDLHSTFAQNTATVSLINDRLQVANAAAQYATLTQVNDRVQVANASPFVATAFSNTVPNYGAAVTYNVQANGQTGFVVSNMGSGVLYWQIPHDISGSGNNYQLYSSANTNFEANVVIKDTGAI